LDVSEGMKSGDGGERIEELEDEETRLRFEERG
jgi:hypothetical protein